MPELDQLENEKNILNSIIQPPPEDKDPAELKDDEEEIIDDPNPIEEDIDDNPEDDEDSLEDDTEDYLEDEDDLDDDLEEDDEVETHEVVINGESVQVSIDELKSSYSGNKFTEKALKDAVDQRNAATERNNEIVGLHQQYVSKLNTLSNILDQAMEEPDWDKLRADSPEAYIQARDQWDDVQKKREAVAQEQAEAQAQYQQMQEQAQQQFVDSQRNEIISKIPDLADNSKAQKIGQEWLSTVKEYGFTEQEFAQVVDHRLLLMLNDLSRLKQRNGRRTEKVKQRKQRVKTNVRPNSATSRTRSDVNKRKRQADRDKARKTGAVDDVARTLILEP